MHQRRTPFKSPLYPSEAWQIIEDMILPHMELVTLGPKEYREVVHHCAVNSWAGAAFMTRFIYAARKGLDAIASTRST